ncbi:hypothetical protein ASPACDRAFT_46105 [Aspergillus aculeatus ATCC 16872]|uniref:Uncharacterized protein n=1 Tax=Aspergillus aculeatus (strain ATCC 16872 / CBS 172.66 / WB 5094) TaxID=690307 RepID=A0A1L9WM76_ASPA1|nr:uncharacterized protein ASPACDRAFT_46105 [Aspergillus aculeatus ATCC 16872]OJJ97251.1 hypothetical protein ASPACDRAFT_46105 [Aspergillus aculeatus ATCC 16872]
MFPDVFWSHRPPFPQSLPELRFRDRNKRRVILTRCLCEQSLRRARNWGRLQHDQQSLSAYGLDSIVAVDFCQWLAKIAEVEVSLFTTNEVLEVVAAGSAICS